MSSSQQYPLFHNGKAVYSCFPDSKTPPRSLAFFDRLVYGSHEQQRPHVWKSGSHPNIWRQQCWTIDPTSGHTMKFNVLALGYGSATRNGGHSCILEYLTSFKWLPNWGAQARSGTPQHNPWQRIHSAGTLLRFSAQGHHVCIPSPDQWFGIKQHWQWIWETRN